MRLSLRNRLASVFFAITLVAIAALYLYVAPGLQTRLVNQKRSELAAGARRYSGPIAETIGSSAPLSVVRNWESEAARFTPELKVLVHHGAHRHADDSPRP